MSLHVDETGTPGAPTIVFLHGIGTSGWMWGRQIAALADFHCMTVDLPGHGKSNRVPWISLADTADQVAELIQARAADGRAHVVGLSLGGQVALVLLERHTGVLQSAVISGVTAAPMPSRALLGPQMWLTSALFKTNWFLNAQARRVPPDMQPALIENMQAMSMEAYRRIWEEVADYSVPVSLQHVHTHTLITAGGNESAIIRQAVDVISRFMPNAQGCLAPGLGHGWNVEAPDIFSAMVRAWISGTPLPDGLQAVHGDVSTMG
ncbi:MAG TPA: alpha/beta hydrolase [Chloroflexia bacterium]|nr:alpha/beta hydrolase [Chloroflexia bacterium]